MTAGLGNEFNLQRKENGIIKRSTTLPQEYKDIANEIGLPVETYGELAFIKQALDQSSEGREEYAMFYKKVLMVGLDSEVLLNLR